MAATCSFACRPATDSSSATPKLDWEFESVPQAGLNGRRIYFPRGKALGGSSIMNGMIYMRGIPEDYDSWRQSGLQGWGFADLLPYFRRSQGSKDRRNTWHGVDGPLKTERSSNFGTLEQAFIEAAVAAGHKSLDDFNGAERTGIARTDSTVYRGVRQSSSIAYLDRPPPNLTVLTHRRIARLILEGHRAAGIETVNGERLRARREVVLCQGAFGTPQTLMLSGIGPADHLSSLGIEALCDLPGVGENLADHVDVSMQYGSTRMDLSLARYQRLDRAAALMARWLLNGKGPGGGPFFSVALFHALEDPRMPRVRGFHDTDGSRGKSGERRQRKNADIAAPWPQAAGTRGARWHNPVYRSISTSSGPAHSAACAWPAPIRSPDR